MSPPTESGNGASMTLMSGANQSGWKSSNICMEILLREGSWRVQKTGPGRVGGFTIWAIAVFLRWIESHESITQTSNYDVCATHGLVHWRRLPPSPPGRWMMASGRQYCDPPQRVRRQELH